MVPIPLEVPDMAVVATAEFTAAIRRRRFTRPLEIRNVETMGL
jgi:hypothetical protein